MFSHILLYHVSILLCVLLVTASSTSLHTLINCRRCCCFFEKTILETLHPHFNTQLYIFSGPVFACTAHPRLAVRRFRYSHSPPEHSINPY